MRLALIIAPSDLRSGDLGLRREALAWLRGRLSRFGFHVVIVGGAQDPRADIERAVARVNPGDTVLVHASGILAGRDSIAFGEAVRIPLGSLTEALAERAPVHVSFVLELAHEEPADDALLAAEILAEAMQSLGAKPRGYPVLAAVRPLAMNVDRVAFTRLALPAANDHAGPPQTEALVAGMYEAASATEESHGVAQSFTFSRGGASLSPPAMGPGYAYGLPAIAPLGEVAEPVAEDAIEEVVSVRAPLHSDSGPSIHSLIAEATEMRDWARALDLRRHRLHELASPRQKSRELVAIARILQVEFGDSEGAIAALEMARALAPRPVNVLQALKRGYEKLGRWAQAVEVTGALAALTESPVERAILHVTCGRITLEFLSDHDRAIAWFLAAVSDDPSNAEAQAALMQLRPPQAAHDPSPAHAAFFPQASDAASFPQGAYAAPPIYAAPVPQAPQAPPEPDADERERTAERLFAEGSDDAALVELEAAAAREPTRVSLYEKAFASHRRTGQTDAALLAALALEELEAADVDHQILIDQFRTVGPVRVRSSLDESTWAALRAPGSDDVLTALFVAVENAAIAARVDELREQRQLVALDPADRLSEASTASIVRSFQWAARVLSVGCPNLYLRDDVPGGIAAIHSREPSTGLGPSVLSGPSAKELAFLAGRHLTFYRPGHQVLLYYPDRDDLTTLLLAAAQVAIPKAAAPSKDPAVVALRVRIARHIEADELAALRKALRDLDARGGQAALGAWMCSVELTAGRAGLLLSGDLAAATAMLRAESRDVANVPVETRRGDLIAFCASRTHARMRQQFAMTAPESLHPAPAPSAKSLPAAPPSAPGLPAAPPSAPGLPTPSPSSSSVHASLGPAL
jgi:tetratricopeptide (TPR) repeat protein